jgi:hypothetical protein
LQEIDAVAHDQAIVASTMVTVTEREAAARRVVAIITSLGRGGAADLDVLFSIVSTASAPPARIAAAARILSELPSVDAARRLIEALLRAGGPYIDASHLARLGRYEPVPEGVLPSLTAVKSFERSALVRAVFRHQSSAALALLPELLAGFESVAVEAAIDGMARWNDPSPLHVVLDAPPLALPPDLPRDLAPDDVRPHAAFHLALLGDRDGLDRLLMLARDRNATRAALAVVRLAWLAHPDGVVLAAAALRQRGRLAVGLALDAVVAYAAAALGPALIALAQRTLSSRTSGVADDAIGAIISMTGTQLDPRPIECTAGATGDMLSTVGRQSALQLLTAAVGGLDPELRYRSGRLLMLNHLVDELSSPHDGERITAMYQLRAITGEDHGGEPGGDAITNLAAIDAWRARARNAQPTPGQWAFRGVPLPPPVMP